MAESDGISTFSINWAIMEKSAKRAFDEGVAQFNERELDSAIASFTEAIRIDPNYADACFSRGVAYEDTGEHDRAIADYTEAIRLDPTDADAYYCRGFNYWVNDDYDKAIADCTEAIRLNPQHAGAYSTRGVAYSMTGDQEKAIADYTEAIRLDPNYSLAYFNRGLAYEQMGDKAKAESDYAQVKKLHKAPMKILFLHGWQSTPGGVKPTYLKEQGHEVLNPALPDDDFDAAVRIAQAEFDRHRPDVVVGSSRGGAVAMNIDSGSTPLVLAVPNRFQAGHISTSGVEPESIFIATAPPRLDPTTTSGRCRSNSAWAKRTAASKSSSGRAGFKTSWP